MADITWTEQALADVEAVCFYIARDAPCYAALFARRSGIRMLITLLYEGSMQSFLSRDAFTIGIARHTECSQPLYKNGIHCFPAKEMGDGRTWIRQPWTESQRKA
jgi:hypothetical protein